MSAFWHKLGFHDWHFSEKVYCLYPLCGPYDPRSEEERREQRNKFICCICGRIKVQREPSFDLP